MLAKSNMAEFAFSPYETVNSLLPGYTRNPYALDRVTAGSSGGTAAAVAANFGAIGLGSDTGNSIRGPSSHQALAGIRSTMGLTSRAGVVPLSLLADIAGPMTRTVADAVAVFQVIAGEDPDDPATAAARGRPIPNYAQSLQRDGLKGARIGILRQAYERDDDRSRRSSTSSWPRSRTSSAPARRSSIPRASISPRCARPQGGGPVRRLQVRHQPVSRRAGRSRAGAHARGDHPLAPVPSVDRGAAAVGAGRHARTGPTRRRARRKRTIATRSARRWRRRWTRTSSTRSSIRRGATRRG